MSFYDQETEENILNSKKYNLLLDNEDYELTMNLRETFIEFKLTQKNIISLYYYQEKFDLQTINHLLSSFFKELKEVFEFYVKALNRNLVKLIKNNIKMNLNMIYIIKLNEEMEINLELKKIKFTKDDIIDILIKEMNGLKNELNSENLDKYNLNKIINDNFDKKFDEINKENQRIMDEKISKKEFELKLNDFKKDYDEKITQIQKWRIIKILMSLID